MKFRNLEEKTQLWMKAHADSPQALWLLSFVAFFESSIFPLPPSAFMLGMVALGDRRRWFHLALLTTLMSVAGGLFGYIIGAALYDTLGRWIIEQYHLMDDIAYIGTLFAKNAFSANFVGAFTPIPYKAFTIASGFFSIHIVTFTIASLVGRGLRFFILAYLAKLFGERVARGVLRYFALITLLALAVIVFVIVFLSL